MLSLLPGVALFLYCIFGFCREVRLDCQRYLEQDRLGDAYILMEMETFLREKVQAKQTLQCTGNAAFDRVSLSPQKYRDSCN